MLKDNTNVEEKSKILSRQTIVDHVDRISGTITIFHCPDRLLGSSEGIQMKIYHLLIFLLNPEKRFHEF